MPGESRRHLFIGSVNSIYPSSEVWSKLSFDRLSYKLRLISSGTYRKLQRDYSPDGSSVMTCTKVLDFCSNNTTEFNVWRNNCLLFPRL